MKFSHPLQQTRHCVPVHLVEQIWLEWEGVNSKMSKCLTMRRISIRWATLSLCLSSLTNSTTVIVWGTNHFTWEVIKNISSEVKCTTFSGPVWNSFESVQNLVHLRDTPLSLGPLENDEQLRRVLDQRPHELLPPALQVLVPEPGLKPVSVRPLRKLGWMKHKGFEKVLAWRRHIVLFKVSSG